MRNNLKKIFILVNDPIFVYQHLLPILDILKYKSQVYIISSYKKNFNLNFENIKVINVPIKREPDFIDIYALFKFLIIRFIFKPDLCISFTPKAGLINSLTAIQGCESSHYFTGQRWANLTGIRRWLLKYIDKFIARSCSKVYCDSISQAKYISKELNVNGVEVFGKGSISGVNIEKFNIKKKNALKLLKNSNKLKSLKLIRTIEDSCTNKIKIICFIGRVHKDKGIKELIKGFKEHNKVFKDSFLLIIGPNELNKEDFNEIINSKNCMHIDFFKSINLILPFAYCLILPSYREGFGSIIIEAAAAKVPIIATDIPGPKDFIEHMHNGYLIKPKYSLEVTNALNFFRNNNKLLETFSKNAFNKCLHNYDEKDVCNLITNEILKKN